MWIMLIISPRQQAPWEQEHIGLDLSYILSAQQGAWLIVRAPKIWTEWTNKYRA